MNEPPPSPASTTPNERAAEARTLGLVGLAIFCSRILGLVREVCLGALFGGAQSRWRDCFNVAFRAPNMLRDLFAEGALSTAFVTVFSQKNQRDGPDSAWLLAQRMATLTAIFMSIVSLIGVITAPLLIRIMAGTWYVTEPDKFEFTVFLTRIMYPFILIVSMSALVMGMLNAKKIFGIPAMASSFFNLGSIIGGGILGYLMDPTWGKTSLIGFSIGTLIGGLAQLFCQFPALHRLGFRWKWDTNWRGDSGVKKILTLMLPAIVAGAAVQVNVLLNTIFATMIPGDGPVSWLGFAFRLMQLPLGLFGVAIATITLPTLARQAADGGHGKFRNTLAQGIRLTLFLTIPSGLGLAILAEPIISLIFGHGKFNETDIIQTAAALRAYSLGLVFYSGIKILQPAFYALDKKNFPMIVSLISIGVSALLNAVFVMGFHFGHASLALTTALAAGLNFILLYFGMRKHTGHIEDREFLHLLGKLTLAAGLMLLICCGGKFLLMSDWYEFGLIYRALALGITISFAGLIYMGSSHWLQIEEGQIFTKLITKKLDRTKT